MHLGQGDGEERLVEHSDPSSWRAHRAWNGCGTASVNSCEIDHCRGNRGESPVAQGKVARSWEPDRQVCARHWRSPPISGRNSRRLSGKVRETRDWRNIEGNRCCYRPYR